MSSNTFSLYVIYVGFVNTKQRKKNGKMKEKLNGLFSLRFIKCAYMCTMLSFFSAADDNTVVVKNKKNSSCICAVRKSVLPCDFFCCLS